MHITKDRVVSIDYTLTDKNNHFIDSTVGAVPLNYLHGHENIIPGLEQALEGKQCGESFSVYVPAADAYGERDESLILVISRDNFDEGEDIEEGMQFEANSPSGSQLVTVTKIDGDEITIDGNNSLAGMDLNFFVTIQDIREALPEEIAHGHPHAQEQDCACCNSEECCEEDATCAKTTDSL